MMEEEKVKTEKQEPVKQEPVKKISTGALIKDLLSGTMVTDKLILKNLGFLFLLTFLGAIYIANRFHAEKITRESGRLQREVRDLRSESLSTSASLMHESNQSEVFRLVKEHDLGLEELREPPYKLIVRGN
jgi:hypothetical protein